MDVRRTRRLLIAAFALSLIIHLIIASGVHWPFTKTSDETEVVHVQHLRVTRIARVPTPAPHTPPPQTATPAPTASPAPVRSAAPRRPSRNPAGVLPAATGTGGTAATAVPSPARAPSPAPSVPCANNDLPATIAASPPPSEISPEARAANVSGTARVRVTLDDKGAVQSAAVSSSSGNSSLDLVAVSMARAAQYNPARHDCKAIASDYTYSVKFVSW